MNRFNKVIFVCMGNTCRSPMAATIMSNLMPDMRCESRGVVVLFPEPYNPKAVAVASRHGMIMPSNVSVQIANEDFSIDTLVLTMNSSMKQKMYDTFDKQLMYSHLERWLVRVMWKCLTHMARGLKSIISVLNSYIVLLQRL